jgi:hypothetical protein
VPIGAGGAGILYGPAMLTLGAAVPADLDSHYRYLSGLLLAIGLGFASTIPRIEHHSNRVRLLAGLVVLGGLGRLFGAAVTGWPSGPMAAALCMELIVTPALALWQYRVARRARGVAIRQGE